MLILASNLPLNIDLQQILLHMLNFAILAVGLTVLLYDPIKNFMNSRGESIGKQLSDIESEKESLAALRAEYEDMMKNNDKTMAERTLESDKAAKDKADKIIRDAEEKAKGIIAAAEAQAEELHRQYLEAAQKDVGELVVKATEKLLNKYSDGAVDSVLYDDFLNLSESDKDF